jgi:hypothetical protein
MAHNPPIERAELPSAELAKMGLLTRFLGGDSPETQWVEGEWIEGTYIGWQQMEFDGKPVPMFTLLERSGTVVRFLGTSQTTEIIYLPSGIDLAIMYIGKAISSKGRRVKLFQIRCDADALASRAAVIREQLRGGDVSKMLPAPMPGLPQITAEPTEDE